MKTPIKLLLTFASLGVVALAAAQTVYSNNPSPGDNYTSSQTDNSYFQVITSSINPVGGGVNEAWSYEAIKGGAHEGINTNYANNGNGSAWMDMTGAPNEKCEINYRQYAGVLPQALGLFTDLNGWSIDSYTSTAGTDPNYGNASAAVRCFVTNGTNSGYLVFDTNWNSGNPTVVYDQWNHFDLVGSDLVLHAAGGLQNVFDDQNRSLSTWKSMLSGYSVTEFNAGVGTSSLGFQGAVDNYAFSFGNGLNRTFNFEAAPVPEPASMAVVGFGLIAIVRKRRARR